MCDTNFTKKREAAAAPKANAEKRVKTQEVDLAEADAEQIKAARTELQAELNLLQEEMATAWQLFNEYIPKAFMKKVEDGRQEAVDAVDFAEVIVNARKGPEGVKAIVAKLNSNNKMVRTTVRQLKIKMKTAESDKDKDKLSAK